MAAWLMAYVVEDVGVDQFGRAIVHHGPEVLTGADVIAHERRLAAKLEVEALHVFAVSRLAGD